MSIPKPSIDGLNNDWLHQPTYPLMGVPLSLLDWLNKYFLNGLPENLVFNIDYALGRNLNKYLCLLKQAGRNIFILNNHFNAFDPAPKTKIPEDPLNCDGGRPPAGLSRSIIFLLVSKRVISTE